MRILALKCFYHTGRILSYSLMGAFVGVVGGRLLLLPLLQQYLSVVLGVLLIGAVAGRKYARRTPVLERVVKFITGRMSSVLRLRPSIPSMTGLGFLNGFLPCGFVYVALSTAAVTANAIGGALLMAGFGAGTVPAMLGLSLFPQVLSGRIRGRIAGILPALQILVGVLLILRGLGLGIPYLSPKGSHMGLHAGPPPGGV